MKHFLLTLTIVIGCSLLASCEKETILTVNQSSLSFNNSGGSQTVNITANKVWRASSNQSWCKVSPSSGDGSDNSNITLSVSCDANATYDERTCTITITCEELTKTISVSQAEGKGLILSQTEYNLTNDAQTISVEVQANVNYSVEIDNACKSWIKQEATKGLSSNVIKFAISKNEDYDGREGKIVIKQTDGSLSGTVVVKQSQQNGLFISTPEYSLSNEKHTLTVEVKANIEFDVKSNVYWIKHVETKGLKTSQIVLEVSANEDYDGREGTVVVKQKNGDLQGVITIKQEQNYGILVSQSEYSVSDEAQTIEVEVKYNVDFDVVIPSGSKDWIRQVSTKGLNSRTYTFSIAKNDTYGAREGSITFKQKNGALSGTVSVKQSQNNGLFVTKTDYEISNESQTVSVEVKANIEFDVKSDTEWVKVVETKGLKTSTITLSIEENDSYDLREGKVSVKQIDGDLSGDITIKQKGKNGIILPQTEFELTNEAQKLNVEVQSTVQFEVLISDSGKDWVSLVSTKALDTKTCSFSIKKNDTYDNRECTVTIKQKGGEMSNSFTIKQAQTDILEVSPTEFTVDVEGGTIAVNVKSNIGYDVAIAEDAVSWLSQIETKAPEKGKINFSVASCADDVDRTGKITISKKDFKFTISVHQYSFASNTIIKFADDKVKAKLVEAFDTNNDGELSIREARAVKSIEGVFGAIKTYNSFDEFQYFTGVTTIPDYMFQGWRLKSIILPTSIKTIQYGAFKECTALQKIEIPYGVSAIEAELFRDCHALSQVVLPETIQGISNYAFTGCNSLASITLPESLTTIYSYAFFDCKGIKSITIPEKVTTIPYACFSGCSNLTRVVIKGDVNLIGEYGFRGCTNLVEIKLPAGIEYIEEQAFAGCASLKTIDIPIHCLIGRGAFMGCSGLQAIKIPEAESIIRDDAFRGCSSLSTVTIPESITKIGNYAFSGCSSLKSIIVPESVSSIGNFAFEECTSLSSIGIPESVISIGNGAFSKCSSLKSIVIPDSVSSIGSELFYYCTSLTSAVFPNGITEILASTFDGCSSLESFTIPDGVTLIGSAAFCECSKLKTISIPSSVKKIYNSFIKCRSLSSVSIPVGVTELSGSFEGCTGLTSISLPESLTIIGDHTFSGCKSLKSIEIPYGVSVIEPSTFINCSGLVSVIIPNSVKTIGDSAFYGCSSLQTITIPESVSTIAAYSINSCTILKEIKVLAKTPPTLGPFAFWNSNVNECIIYVLPECLNSYLTANGWKEYAGRIQAIP